jgi:Tol biopolymer transport system component
MLKFFLQFITLIWFLLVCLMFMMRGISQINSIPVLAYISNADHTNSDIILADVNSGLAVNISNFERQDDTLQWSPDGRYLTFRSTGDTYWNYYLLDTSNWQTTHLISFESDTSIYWYGLQEILLLDNYSRLSQILELETGAIRNTDANDECGLYCPFQPLSDYQLKLSLVNDELNVELSEIDWTSNTLIDFEKSPIWSADKQYFIFRTDLQGQSDLYLSGIEGGIAQRLTNTDTSENMVVWSSDGRWISYTDYVEARLDVFVLDLETMEIRNISHYPLPDFSPSWQPIPDKG